MPTIRPTQQEDLKELGELLDGIFRRPRGITDQSMLTDFPLVFAPTNWRNGRVVFEDGRLATHAALWPREAVIDGERLRVGVLVSVATHPDYRNRGYAAEAVKSLQERMREEGYDLGLLWTGVPEFYLKMGWELVDRRGTTILFDAARLPDFPADIAVSRFDSAPHAEAIYALHEKESVRLARSPEESRVLLTLPKIDVWAAARDNVVIGYGVHARSCNKRGLIEYGGALEAIVSVATHIARTQASGTELPLLAYHVRPDLVEWARRIGLPLAPLNSSKGFGHEMIYSPRGNVISPIHRTRLFAWGLDQA